MEDVDNVEEEALAPELDVTKMKVVDLKRELKTRGLSVTGNKNELLERLQESLCTDEDSTTPELMTSSVDDLGSDELIDSVLAETEKEPTPPPEVEQEPEVVTKPKVVLNRDLSSITNFGLNKENEEKKETKNVREMTQLERLELRAKRFGVTPSAEAKRVARLEKFESGGNKVSSGSGQSEVSKIGFSSKSPFGMVTSTKLAKIEEVERMQKRQKRFSGGSGGDVAGSTGNVVVDPAKKLEDEERKLKRAARFGLSSDSSTTSSNEELKAKRAKKFGLVT